MLKVTRHQANPILQNANDIPWCKGGVRNPSAIAEGDVVRMLFTANWKKSDPACKKMQLAYAQSTDGVHFECGPQPTAETATKEGNANELGL